MRSNTNHLLLVAAALAVALCPASAALSSRELGSADCPSCSSHTTANGVTITDDFETAWMSRKAMPYSCSDASATTIKDQIYLVGGCVEKQAWVPADPNDPNAWASYVCPTLTNKGLVFDPSKNTFAAIAASPRQRYRHTAASVGGKLYLFGGRDVTDTLVGDVDEFDPATGAWKAAVCSMGALAVSDLAAFVHEGVAYVAGGYDAAYTASNATYKFVAPTASAPTCSFARVVGGDMHTPRGDFAIAEVKGKAYAVGGFTHTNWDMPQSSMETFDTATNTWSLRPSAMSVARGDKVVLALNSAIHVVGGETKDAKGNSVPIEVVEMYLEVRFLTKGGGVRGGLEGRRGRECYVCCILCCIHLYTLKVYTVGCTRLAYSLYNWYERPLRGGVFLPLLRFLSSLLSPLPLFPLCEMIDTI